jgi:DNA-binding FadR family transcriptional regulator
MLSTAKRRSLTPPAVASCKVKLPKAAEIVSQRIRTQIIRGEIREGAALPNEKELMQRFGVSRPTLREAIRILESEGLVSTQRGSRGGVIAHSPDLGVATRYVSLVLQASGTTLMDIHRVHRLIEPAAARIVAEQFASTAPAVLRDCVQRSRSVFDDDFEFGIATAGFRNKLIELTQIPTLGLLMSMVNDIFQRYWATMAAAAGQRLDSAPAKRRALRSLDRLIELIESGDGDGAEEHWRKHTELAEKGLRDWIPARQVIDLLDE